MIQFKKETRRKTEQCPCCCCCCCCCFCVVAAIARRKTDTANIPIGSILRKGNDTCHYMHSSMHLYHDVHIDVSCCKPHRLQYPCTLNGVSYEWSSCHGSVEDHWWLKPEVSWVQLPAFTFLHFHLITSKCLYIPLFLLAQHLSSKWIAPTDNMQPNLHDKYIVISC